MLFLVDCECPCRGEKGAGSPAGHEYGRFGYCSCVVLALLPSHTVGEVQAQGCTPMCWSRVESWDSGERNGGEVVVRRVKMTKRRTRESSVLCEHGEGKEAGVTLLLAQVHRFFFLSLFPSLSPSHCHHYHHQGRLTSPPLVRTRTQ